MSGTVKKRGNSWQVRYRGPDRKERTKTFRIKAEAEQWLAGQITDMARGVWVDPKGGRTTLAEWWVIYMSQSVKRPATRARDEDTARNWLLPRLGPMRLQQITPVVVRAVIADMQKAGLAPSTVRTYYGVLQGAMTAAVDADLIGRSPCRGIRLETGRRREPRFLNVDELLTLADAIDPNYRAMVILSGVGGLRFGECAGLRVGRIDFLRRTVKVSETINEVGSDIVYGAPKTEASGRTVAMPPLVIDELAAHLSGRAPVGPDDLVFTSPAGLPLRRKHFRKRVWKPAVEAAGFEDLTFHGLRHSAAGLMIQLRTHPRVIQKRLGHSSIRTTMDVYGSVLDEVDAEVVDGLNSLLSEERRGHSADNG